MNFDYLTNLDTSEAVRELAINAPLWDAFTTRQTFPGSPHVDTRCIPLRGDLARPFALGVTRPRTPFAKHLPACMGLVNTALAGMEVQEVGLAMLVSLAAGGRIIPHRDEGPYAAYFSRMHIVVASGPGNWFRCGGEVSYPVNGSVFLFNHHDEHEAGNDSNKSRVHIIVDVKLKEPQWQSQQ